MTGDMDQFDKQMKEIDEAMAKPPPPPPTAPPPAVQGTANAPTKRVAPTRLPAGSRREVISVWVRLVLVITLTMGLTVWPYSHDCGFGLAGYLAAIGVTIGTGVMTAVSTWRWRLGVPHLLSLMVSLGGLALLAHEIALRAGYAATELTWFCP